MLRLRNDIPLFPNGKKKALTLSYDDGVTQDERLISLMKKYNIKGTFNLNAGLMGDKDWLEQSNINVSHYKFEKQKIEQIYAEQEIAVHTMTHLNLTNVPEGVIAHEIVECRKELENIIKSPVTGMAYPFGAYNNKVKNIAKACGIQYSRTTKQTFKFSLPEDFLEWHSTCHHTEKIIFELLNEFLKPIDNSEYFEPKLFYIWGHSYEFDAFNQWKDIEKFFEEVSFKEDIWYATNIQICEYINALKQLIYSATGDYIYNPTCLDIWLMIDKKTYCVEGGKTIKIDNI